MPASTTHDPLPNTARALVAAAILAFTSNAAALDVPLPMRDWQIVKRESGPVNYYQWVDNAKPPHVRARYRPPLKTVVVGYQLADGDRRPKALRWKWRAVTLPKGGDECVKGKGDSAASVYVTFRRGLRWYTLKYVWSTAGKRGATCARKRNPFMAQDTIILRSGGPLNEWQSESIDIATEFRNHFEDGDPKASVPDLLGIGIMTDGDQTNTVSAADYGEFVLTR